MQKRSILISFLVAALLVLTSVAAAQDAPRTFTFGEFGDPVKLDSAVVTDGISFRVTRQGCENLLEFVPGTTQVGPGLAKSWSVSDDGLVWTLGLEEGVMFHDGTPFNAEAVKWNFDRWRLSDHPQHFAEAAFEYYEAQFGGLDDASNITSVEATGEYEVTITLSQPMGAFLNNLSMSMFSIHSPAAIEAAGADYGTPSVGYVCTGPYKFVRWETGVEVVLERNADYWAEVTGNVERVVYRPIPDNAARFAALQNGTIDAFEQPNVQDIPAIEADDNLYIMLRPSFNVFYLAFNYRIAEFRNPLVREAISLAINREEIVDAFYVDGAVPANTMNPPTIAVGFNDEIVTPYDPELAMQKLAEAGFPDGIDQVSVLGVDADGNVTDEVVETIPVRVYYMPVVRPYNPAGEAIGEAMASYLQDIGINAELASAGDWATYLAARASGELLGLYQLGWTGDNGDPDNFIGYFFAGASVPLAREGFYQNAEVADLLLQGRVLSDPAAREALYDQAEAIMAAGAERVYVAHGPVPLAFSQRVSGYIPSPMGDEKFDSIVVAD